MIISLISFSLYSLSSLVYKYIVISIIVDNKYYLFIEWNGVMSYIFYFKWDFGILGQPYFELFVHSSI